MALEKFNTHMFRYITAVLPKVQVTGTYIFMSFPQQEIIYKKKLAQ
jgi:hypothetical protein